MDDFSTLANLMDLDIDGQLDALNREYKGKIKFIKDTNTDRQTSEEYQCIAIAWSDESVNGIELPNCEYIDYREMFYFEYQGNITYVGLPKNKRNRSISFDRMDKKAFKLNTLVVDDGEDLTLTFDLRNKYVPRRLVVRKPSGNNKVYELRREVDPNNIMYFII